MLRREFRISRDYMQGPPVIFDVNEPKEVEAYLNQMGIPTIRQKLERGDIIVGKYTIERKTIGDLFSSVILGRYWKQIEGLSEIPDRAILLEGITPPKEDIYDFNQYWGIYFGTTLGWNVPILPTRSHRESARVLKELYRRQNSPKPFVRPFKRMGVTKEERKSNILCCTRGIGRKQAEILLKEKETVFNIINTSKEELYSIKGVRKSSIDNLFEDLKE